MRLRSRPTSIGILSLGLIFLIILGLFSWINNQSSSKAAVSFVTRSNSQLLLNGQPFRFAGANMQWLGLDDFDDDGHRVTAYPSDFRVKDGLATAKELGLTVVRAHSLGFSTGCSLCIEPSLGIFNETALRKVDFAV